MPRKLLKLKNASEELQDHIADNSELGYVVGGTNANFTIGQLFNWEDAQRLLGESVLLTLYDDGHDFIHTGGQKIIEKSWRFVTKGSTANQALDRVRDVETWLLNKRQFSTDTYVYWFVDEVRSPAVVARGENGSHLAETILRGFVLSRV